MPTLNIGGQRVNVGDDFLSLSPDEQNQAVQGIASQLQTQPQPVAPAAPAAEEGPPPGYIPSGQELSTDAMRAALQAARNVGENIVAFPGETVAMGARGMNWLAKRFPNVVGPPVPAAALEANIPLPTKAEVTGVTSKALEMAGLPSKPYEAKYWLGKTVAWPVEHAPELMTVSRLLEDLFPQALTNAPRLAEAAQPALKTVDELQVNKSAAYQAADQAGQNYTPQQYQYVVDKTAQAAQKFGANEVRHPQTLSVIDDLKKRLAAGEAPPTSVELDTLRGQLSQIMRTDKSAAERTAAGHLLNAFDKATEVVDASYPLRQTARQANVVYEKAKTIQDIFDKAQRQADRTGGDFSQILRARFNQLADNANRMRQFSSAERTAINNFVKGGRLENVLTGLSKSTATGSLPATALGYLMGGPLGAFAGPGTSSILRQGMRDIAGRMTLSKAEAIRALIQNPPAATAAIARRFPQISQEQIAELVKEAAKQAAALQGQ